MKRTSNILFLMITLLMAACSGNTQQPAATADTATATQLVASNNLEGVYIDTLPCADCPGIKSTLVLSAGGTYTMVNEYLERATKDMISGQSWKASNGTLVLDSTAHSKTMKFKIEANSLRQLDMNGNVIDGPMADKYIYKKQ